MGLMNNSDEDDIERILAGKPPSGPPKRRSFMSNVNEYLIDHDAKCNMVDSHADTQKIKDDIIIEINDGFRPLEHVETPPVKQVDIDFFGSLQNSPDFNRTLELLNQSPRKVIKLLNTND